MKRRTAYLIAWAIIFVPAVILTVIGINYIRNYNQQAREEFAKVSEIIVDFRNKSNIDVSDLELVVFGKGNSNYKEEKLPTIKANSVFKYERKRNVDIELTTAQLYYKSQKFDLTDVKIDAQNKVIVIIEEGSTKDKLILNIIKEGI